MVTEKVISGQGYISDTKLTICLKSPKIGFLSWPNYMCEQSLNEICGSVFELLCRQVKTYSGGCATDMKPVYTPVSIGYIIRLLYSILKSVTG